MARPARGISAIDRTLVSAKSELATTDLAALAACCAEKVRGELSSVWSLAKREERGPERAGDETMGDGANSKENRTEREVVWL